MKVYSVTQTIQASRETIWAILTDASSWPDWNTTIDKVEGRIALGEKIKVFTKLTPGRAFPAKITEFLPGKKMTWTGGMPLGLFKGERTYTLTNQSNGAVEFAMREVYTGLMAPLITRSIPDLQPSFDEFAAALKNRAEGGG
ncbi:SRPBCC domain-containing protein [Candidatus Poribacteria bacterium]|nr:SRPBCC domain-containing protein [Candidatus Poribacteria bacterium]